MEDIQSTALLSVPLQPVTMIAIMELNDELEADLSEIPTRLDLADAPDAVEPWDGIWVHANAAHWTLRQVPGVARTVASKLLARKRPALLPVWDTRVAQILGSASVDNDWLLVQSIVRTHSRALETLRRDLLLRLDHDDRVAALTPLRVLDIAMWMSGESSG